MSSSQYRLLAANIAGEGKIGQRRECDIVRPPDARFQHPPHHTGMPCRWQRSWMRRDTVYPPTRPSFDVDDFAGVQFDGRLRLLLCMDALVQADRRLEFFCSSTWL